MAEGSWIGILILIAVVAIGIVIWNLVKEEGSGTTATLPDDPSASASSAEDESQISQGLPALPQQGTGPLPHSEPDSTTGRAATKPTQIQKKIFLSYRREDSADVSGRIYDRLTQAFEKAQVFKDVDSIPLGLDFRKHLQQTVTNCDVVLVVVGDRWLTASTTNGKRRLDDPKDFVRIELETALQREIPVIPVLVRGASVPEETELPPTLSTLAYRNGIAVRSDPDFHRDMDRLIQSLKTHLAST